MKQNFAAHLHQALQEVGCCPFLDMESLEKGQHGHMRPLDVLVCMWPFSPNPTPTPTIVSTSCAPCLKGRSSLFMFSTMFHQMICIVSSGMDRTLRLFAKVMGGDLQVK